jgi:O-antigen ligase
VRFEQFPIAWNIWRGNFLFGAGAGTYTERLSQLNLDWSIPQLVHFVPLFVGAELGLFGVVAYYGLMLATMARLWRLASGPDALARRVAFASLAGLLAYAFDGMSSPLFREPTTYLYFWIIAGLSAALLREASPPREGEWPGIRGQVSS